MSYWDQYNQEQRDIYANKQSKQNFKRQELEAELGHEDSPNYRPRGYRRRPNFAATPPLRLTPDEQSIFDKISDQYRSKGKSDRDIERIARGIARKRSKKQETTNLEESANMDFGDLSIEMTEMIDELIADGEPEWKAVNYVAEAYGEDKAKVKDMYGTMKESTKLKEFGPLAGPQRGSGDDYEKPYSDNPDEDCCPGCGCDLSKFIELEDGGFECPDCNLFVED